AQLSTAAGPASSPYDASRSAPVVPDTGGASLAVVATSLAAIATSEPTYYPQGPSQVLLPLLHTSLSSWVLSELQTLYSNCHNQIELAR
ncbi:hypothetical protein A2U01_0082364, partial [Trifolium medium]|nr:hypothetical protein [Trifolium medium]